MTQSLPSIKSISYLPCSSLPPDLLQKYLSGIPVAVYSSSTHIETYSEGSCEADSEEDNGITLEKTVLQFNTTDDIPVTQDQAFVITDAGGKSYVIGTADAPYPIVEITTKIDSSTNIHSVKVQFLARKSLIPCQV